jgi:hypothetical protein
MEIAKTTIYTWRSVLPTSNNTNLLQMLCTQLHVLLAVTVARDKFAKSYHDLVPLERDETEGIVGGMIRHYWRHYAPEDLLGMAKGASSDSVQ